MTETTTVPPKPVAVARVSKAMEVKQYIEQNKNSMAAVLPKVGLTPEALTRTALSQIYKNPVLLDCDRTSLLRAIVEAAALGLSFSLGRAYLVPFKNKVKGRNGQPDRYRMEAQLMPGYLGLADIARRTGEISSITSQCVYDGDEFQYEFGLERDVLHHKPLTEPLDVKLTHAYAIVRFKDGGYQLVVMTKKQIDAIRKRSKSAESGPWVTDYGPMAKKTVIKQVLKLCPASIELVRAIAMDNAVETGERPDIGAGVFDDGEDFIDIEPEEVDDAPPPPASKTETVKEALKSAKKDAKAKAAAASGGDEPPPPDTERNDLLMTIGQLWPTLWKREKEADIEVSAATGGKLQSIAHLEASGTVDQLKQVLTHFRVILDERQDKGGAK